MKRKAVFYDTPEEAREANQDIQAELYEFTDADVVKYRYLKPWSTPSAMATFAYSRGLRFAKVHKVSNRLREENERLRRELEELKARLNGSLIS